MVDSLLINFASILYRNIHLMKKYNWGLEEIMNIPPLDMNIFKNMIIQENKNKNTN